MRRLLLFGVSIASLLVLTYAGVLLAFSIPVSDEMAAANPDAPRGSRALVVPIAAPTSVATRASGAEGTLLLRGDADGAFPTAAKDVRMGRALVYAPAGANGTVDVDNVTLDLAAMSGGFEGWILRGDAETDPWFAPADQVLGAVESFETPLKLGALFAGGTLGFVAPLVLMILTHKGSRRAGAAPDPLAHAMCRECRAPLAPNADFCMRCGAWAKGDAANA